MAIKALFSTPPFSTSSYRLEALYRNRAQEDQVSSKRNVCGQKMHVRHLNRC
jgi:hypothetical protein